MNRCGWVTQDPLYLEYHDKEWGVPVYDDRLLFEYLNLEGAQAGLSWYTILKKRENYRQAFDNFEPEKIIKYDERKIDELLQNEGIVRNKLKINAVIANAKAYFRVVEEFGSFSAYIWSFVDGKPVQNHFKEMSEVPASTKVSDRLSKDLKRRGFKFVGTTICYAFMQAVGMVNDHIVTCMCYQGKQKKEA
ncbi:DNA-3-methyladenine glycosylase I [Brevibacillus borstelensis]|jgi:DNA-3-methyladenine glycosylase I|uniref:DNA-3-methyladenine glycosylase I n=1 Tax=Brevibacillus TaxID=55080 RepID=UPI0004684A65|nr:DNA-3-methyladenine glycosylase I [Brevibacillus borstelensis]MBE5397337.1 DNA-3-methyladenine glycosylase I [Brevibacillus borstelensis]MCM3472270.1 DNA-3-methyladenine glycosylase I [Brevibacillus borstelensis]MED1744473.1 DNA-3-methyladenine glycosylase I [Brevibacillus borstelensis]MED1853871.1 DNA-3-methyladenine glycosylase I [Brevibacillus borstelensis]MED1874375.1 DNA-3-methyladenine glycosylase I [Brevibacillus borstelensis]